MEREEVQAFLERFAIEARPSRAEHLARELVRARRLTEYRPAHSAREGTRAVDRQLPDPR